MMAARQATPALIDRLPPVRGRLSAGAPLDRITWFRVGGPAEVILRHGPVRGEADQGGELRRRQPFHRPRLEQRGVPLAREAEEVADLLVEDVGLARRRLRHMASVARPGQRSPSRPSASLALRPPTRGSGRPASVTATATMISSARGASGIETSTPSKWERT